MNICFDKKRIGRFVSSQIENCGWGKYQALGIENNGKLIAGVIFNDYIENQRCSMHCAGKGSRWLTKEFLWMCFDYAFNQLGCQVIINQVNSSNIPSMKFTQHIGFTQEHVIKKGYPDGDLVLFTYYKENCRWLDNEKLRRKYYA